MQTDQLVAAVKTVTAPVFQHRYVIARDQLNTINFKKFPLVCIIHSEPIKVKDGHWLAFIVFTKGKINCMSLLHKYVYVSFCRLRGMV